MGSYEEYSSTQQEKEETLLSNLHHGSEKEEESLVEDLKKVILEGNGYGDGDINDCGSENLQEELQIEGNNELPLRPYAEDCSFYLKTGTCKYGSYCRFNHPVLRGFQDKENHQRLAVDQQGRIECKYFRATGGCKYGNACRYKHCNEDYVLAPLEVNSLALPVQREKDGIAEQTGQIECKYYLSSGGCKYGKACRYSHYKEKSKYLEKSELPPPELNFLGLPIRTLEKECPYYMRTGSCAYGSNCRFNHPDPTAAEGSSTFGSDPSGFGNHSPGNYNGEHNAFSSSIEPTAASFALNMLPNEHLTYLNHNSAYAQGMHANSECNGHQEKAYLAPSMDKATKTANISGFHQEQIHVDEYPKLPGEPECLHFMKTGYCKFKSACKFHHPESRLPKPILSNAGLPLRPDRKVCWNYEKSGICKYGISCHFHHPQNLFS